MTERSPSGLFRLFSKPSSSPSNATAKPGTGSHPSVAAKPGTGSHPSVAAKPGSGAFTAVPASSPSGLVRPSAPRGLPAEPKGKAEMLLLQAITHCENGAWAAAETNLRLALTFDPHDGLLKRKLDEVVATRDAQRRAAQQPRR